MVLRDLALFFGLAVIKYANWLTRIEAAFCLRRKIMANTLAALPVGALGEAPGGKMSLRTRMGA